MANCFSFSQTLVETLVTEIGTEIGREVSMRETDSMNHLCIIRTSSHNGRHSTRHSQTRERKQKRIDQKSQPQALKHWQKPKLIHISYWFEICPPSCNQGLAFHTNDDWTTAKCDSALSTHPLLHRSIWSRVYWHVGFIKFLFSFMWLVLSIFQFESISSLLFSCPCCILTLDAVWVFAIVCWCNACFDSPDAVLYSSLALSILVLCVVCHVVHSMQAYMQEQSSMQTCVL